jgi:hypothetical protein
MFEFDGKQVSHFFLTNDRELVIKDIAVINLKGKQAAVAVTIEGRVVLLDIDSSRGRVMVTETIEETGGKSVETLGRGLEEGGHILVSSESETRAYHVEETSGRIKLQQMFTFSADVLLAFEFKTKQAFVAIHEKNAEYHLNLFYWKPRARRWVEGQTLTASTPIRSLDIIEYHHHLYLFALQETSLSSFLMGGNGYFEKLFQNQLQSCSTPRHVHAFVDEDGLYLITSGTSTRLYKTLINYDTCQRQVRIDPNLS